MKTETGKQMKDFAHLYVGCDLLRPDGRTILPIIGVMGSLFVHKENNKLTYSGMTGSKIIARKLDDITEEEKDIVSEIIGTIYPEHFISAWINQKSYKIDIFDMVKLTNTLRLMHFDMDRLIESGLAVNKSTIK